MYRVRFNNDWQFALDANLDEYNNFGLGKFVGGKGAVSRSYKNSNWQKIDLPHDYVVGLERKREGNTFSGAHPVSKMSRFMTEGTLKDGETYDVCWYRKEFEYDSSWTNKRIFIEFEGVFRDSIVWVNGTYISRHNSGYTSFCYEITDSLCQGANSITVRVNCDQHEGWWYEGGGIYRNVNLIIGESTYFVYNKTVVKTDIDGTVKISAKLYNDTQEKYEDVVTFAVKNKDGKIVATSECNTSIEPYSYADVECRVKVENPILWDLENPYLYTVQLQTKDEIESTRFGIRTVSFDVNKGFLLNGKETKVRGACVHQDFGGVGVALADNLIYYKIKKLKEMGCNAYRSAHHAPSPVLLDACDELGMLVMNETRKFGNDDEAIKQLTDLIERDRNHPSVFIWSLGNEEFDVQNIEWSARIMGKMTRKAKALDDTRPVTYGGNNGANDIGANGTSEIRGVNYIRNGSVVEGFKHWLDKYHHDHPTQPIIGTEESSYVLSRGGAENDLGSGLLDSFGNVTMNWASTPKGWVKFSEERPYFAGSFMWTGFDYRGEPNPFYTTNNSSSFGTIDLCGMEKPPFYYYKAWWTNEPVLYLASHWNFGRKKKAKVAVFTNCQEITLYVNGKEVASSKVEKFDLPQFELDYEAGVISVRGIKDGKEYYDEIKTAKSTSKLSCQKVCEAKQDGDLEVYEICGLDKDGEVNRVASDNVEISVKGGKIVGVGNGDPSYYGYEQKNAIEKAVYIRQFNKGNEIYFVPLKADNVLSFRKEETFIEEKKDGYEDDYRYVEKFSYAQYLHTLTLTSSVSGVDDYQYIEFERLGSIAKIYLNGKLIGQNDGQVRPYRFYCKFKKGENVIKIVSDVKEGDSPAVSGYVKIGKLVDEPWNIPLHYGKARVFVKPESNDVQVKVKIVK